MAGRKEEKFHKYQPIKKINVNGNVNFIYIHIYIYIYIYIYIFFFFFFFFFVNKINKLAGNVMHMCS